MYWISVTVAAGIGALLSVVVTVAEGGSGGVSPPTLHRCAIVSGGLTVWEGCRLAMYGMRGRETDYRRGSLGDKQ